MFFSQSSSEFSLALYLWYCPCLGTQQYYDILSRIASFTVHSETSARLVFGVPRSRIGVIDKAVPSSSHKDSRSCARVSHPRRTEQQFCLLSHRLEIEPHMTAAAFIADASAAITQLLAQAGPSLAQRIRLSFHVRHSVSRRGGW